MAKEVASVVICDACGKHVAEIVDDEKRALCSECHLRGARAETSRDDKSDRDK